MAGRGLLEVLDSRLQNDLSAENVEKKSIYDQRHKFGAEWHNFRAERYEVNEK